MSADIVSTQIKLGVDLSTRRRDIAQKLPKCKNSPLTPIVTKISFPTFSVRRGLLTPKKGEDTSGTRVRPHANFGVNRPAGCWEIVDQTKQHTVKQIPRIRSNERVAGNNCNSAMTITMTTFSQNQLLTSQW